MSGILYDKEDSRKYFKALPGDRVKLISNGLLGKVWDVRPTVVNGQTGDTVTSYTVILDKGPNGQQSWPVGLHIDDFELAAEGE